MHMSLCSRLDKTAIKEFCALAIGLCYPMGAVVFEQEDELDRLFIITKGMVRLSHLTRDGRRQIIGFLGPGDLLGGIKRSIGAFCSAEAMTDVETCAFDRKTFGKFLQRHADFCFNLWVVANDEIEAQYDHSVLLARKTASERIAAFLMMLSERWGDPDEDSSVLHIPMPRSDIADHLGLTIETVSRILTQFKNLGYIEFRGPKTVVLTNAAALTYLAGLEDHPKPRLAIGL
ncbi:MAG: Crp/Fnr family transcriptional regulator [Rhodospirillales bacterium]